MTHGFLHASICATLLLVAHAASCEPAADPAAPTRHDFVLKDFTTESGAVLPEARIVYGTTGQLNAARDNAVLLPSHYMADMTGYEWLIGPGKALDPAKLFLITSELFGNGRSSSPSNTAAPFHGPDFPVTTIRDNVGAVHRLLTEELHISHLRAVIGFSMGAQQAFQWAVSYPDFMDRVVATSGTAKTYGHGIVRLESQINAIMLDPAFDSGHYTAEPTRGIEATGLIWLAWLYGQEWWRREYWKLDNPAGTTLAQAIARATTEFFKGAGRQRPDPADADLGKARRGWHAAVPRRRRGGPAVHQGTRPVYAVCHRSVFSGGGCGIRGAVHRPLHPEAHSVRLGASCGRRGKSGRRGLPQRADRQFHEGVEAGREPGSAYGAPWWTRTTDPQLRRLLLYPPELRALAVAPSRRRVSESSSPADRI